MFRLNNKGQSLVMFIILIPIFLLIITLVYDVGNALYEKNRLSNTSYMVIEYGLDNINDIDENDLINLVLKNVYDLNGILISRAKFVRQLAACENLSIDNVLTSLISNSILSDEECDTIKSLSNAYSKKLS